MKWLMKKSDLSGGAYMIWFFNTRWNSKLSVNWYSRHTQWDYQFREGYVDIMLGKLKFRFRRYSSRQLRRMREKEVNRPHGASNN